LRIFNRKEHIEKSTKQNIQKLIFAIFVFFVVKTNQGVDTLDTRFCRGISSLFSFFDTEVGF